MKCFLVVNQLNDTFYIDYDLDFADYIINRAKVKGLLEQDSEVTELDANLVMQLFSPLVLSQWLLIDQTREPCTSIQCPNGFQFVFKHVDDLLYIAINGDGTESESSLHRKIRVCITIMRFMFGPVSEEIGQSHFYTKKAKWDFLHSVMKNWSDMISSEQSFFVEAIERLHVNQVVNEKCVEILEKAVKQVQVQREIPTQHAILLVNSKLLALYSNRGAHELRPKDILAMMILSQTIHPCSDKLEDLFSKHYMRPRTRSSFDEASDGGEDEYHSAPNTPGGLRSRSSSTGSDNKEFSNNSFHSQYKTPSPRQDPVESGFQYSSVSESETVLQGISDQDSDMTQDFSPGNSPSLIDLYKEKYPDACFSEKSKESKNDEKSAFKAEKVVQKNNNAREAKSTGTVTLSVEAIVHNERNYLPEMDTKSHSEKTISSALELQNSGSTHGNVIQTDQVDSQIEIEDKYNLTLKETDPAAGRAACEAEIEGSHKVEQTSFDKDHDQEMVTSGETKIFKVENNESHVSNVKEIVREYLELTTDGETCVSNLEEKESHISITKEAAREQRETVSTNPSREGSRSSTFSSDPSRSSSGSTHNQRQEKIDELYDRKKRLTPTQDRPQSKPSIDNSQSTSVMQTTSSKPVMESTALTSQSQTSSSFLSFSEQSSSNMYWPKTVFLETSTCLYVPYNLHIMQVLPGVALLLLSQAPRLSLADALCQAIHNIQDLIYGRRSKLSRQRSVHVYDVINSLLAKLHNSLRRHKGKVRTLSSDIHAMWEKEDLKHKLLEYLEKDVGTRISPTLESPLIELYKKLKELFSHLFLSHNPFKPETWETLAHLEKFVRKELTDYREYLSVKAQRNITMTTYIDEFPGLVHFIFINRYFHEMTAPSLNISLKAGESTDATTHLKEKIWRMYKHMMRRLTDGYTTIMLREGDFYFSYFLWFEDYTGKPLPVQESFKPSRKFHYPGILGGNFYSDLLHHCFPHATKGSVCCFEMFLVHLGTVHPHYIANHCKKLAKKMWEMSGEPYNYVSLL